MRNSKGSLSDLKEITDTSLELQKEIKNINKSNYIGKY